MTPRIFRYVVRYDAGVAPRPFDGYCSLAICKPRIRASADVGDWIIGFRTRSPGDVIYVMRVEEVLGFPEYWADKRFRNRRPGATSTPDNFYRPTHDGRLEQIPNHVHDVTETATDLSGRSVLLSQVFWYFGNTSPMIPAELVRLIHTGIGHAVDKGRRLDDVKHLANWLAAWPMGLNGNPVDRSLVNEEPLSRGQCQKHIGPASATGVARPPLRAARRCMSLAKPR
jgi:hypothetical protein